MGSVKALTLAGCTMIGTGHLKERGDPWASGHDPFCSRCQLKDTRQGIHGTIHFLSGIVSAERESDVGTFDIRIKGCQHVAACVAATAACTATTARYPLYIQVVQQHLRTTVVRKAHIQNGVETVL
jgi:hypothetical protein